MGSLYVKMDNSDNFYELVSPHTNQQHKKKDPPVWVKVGILAVFAYRHDLQNRFVSAIALVMDAADTTYGVRPGLLEAKKFVESLRDASAEWTDDDWQAFIRANVYKSRE